MSKLTDQQWDEVKTSLKSFHKPVNLNCDGYKVTLKLEQVSQFKNAISVYVNGYLKGIWMLMEKNTEEGQRFFPVIRKSLCSQKEKQDLIKAFGKRRAKKMPSFNSVYEYRKFDWSSFHALKKHFIANNENIELVENNE